MMTISFNRTFNPTGCPCKDCGKRQSGCHSHCGKYAEWKKGVEDANERRRADMDRYSYSDAKKRRIWEYTKNR